jgi:hypothetical protein
MDPPNVLWFAGAYAIALGSYALLLVRYRRLAAA